MVGAFLPNRPGLVKSPDANVGLKIGKIGARMRVPAGYVSAPDHHLVADRVILTVVHAATGVQSLYRPMLRPLLAKASVTAFQVSTSRHRSTGTGSLRRQLGC